MCDPGCPPRIPAKSVIFATVELLDFVDESQADALLSLDPDERNAKHGKQLLTRIGVAAFNHVRRIPEDFRNLSGGAQEWKCIREARRVENGLQIL